MARTIPDHWMALMQQRGISSVRQLAMRSGVSHVTVNRVVFGDPFWASEGTLQKIADALGVEYDLVYQLAGRRVQGAEPWTPPAEASRMTPEHRKLVEQLIRTLVGQQQVARIDHPEQGGVDLAADTSHGPAQSQLEADESL